MSLKDLQSKSASALDARPQDKLALTTPARPVTAPGATAMMQPTIDALNAKAKAAEKRAEEAEQLLKETLALSHNSPRELPLDKLVEIAGRRRKLTPDQFEELRANLAGNQLIQPIAVKQMPDGRYEVVSGHNRLAAYRLLDRATIPATVINIEDSETDCGAFFANLLQPALPDYERYLGFKRWQDATSDTFTAMAQKAGTSKSTVSKLFAFGDLPAEALELIFEKPNAIGVTCAIELARLAIEGRASKVIEAVRLLVAGELNQKEALQFAARSEPKLRSHETGVTVKVKAGRLEYCSYVARGGTLKIDFKDVDERRAAEAAIASVLQELAEQARAS